MPQLVPIEHDPFGEAPSGLPKLQPVEHDPFKPQTLSGKLLEPVTSLPQSYREVTGENLALAGQGLGEARQEGVRMAQEAEAKGYAAPPLNPIPALASVGKTALGALGYTFAPVGAAIRSAVTPVARETGIPREYLEFAAGIAAPEVAPAAVGALNRAYRAVRPVKPMIPTAAELKASGTAELNAPEVTGVQIKPAAVQSFYTDLPKSIESGSKATDIAAPLTYAHADRFAERAAASDRPITIGDLTEQRTIFRNIEQGALGPNGNPHERRAALQAIREIDDMVAKLRGQDVIAGNPQEAAAGLARGRADYSASKSAELLDAKQFRSELRAAAANSGMNVGNTLRARMTDILLNPKLAQSYSQAERAYMERIVYGSPAENAVRFASNVGGGGGGLGSTVTRGIGYGILGPAGAAIPEVATGLKMLSNRMSVRSVEKLNEMVRSDSPLGRTLSNSLQQWVKANQALRIDRSEKSLLQASLTSRQLTQDLRGAGFEFPSLQRPLAAGEKDQEGE